MSNLSVADAVAVCPVGCDTCMEDDNGLAVCLSTGCSAGWVYVANQQCVGQFYCARFPVSVSVIICCLVWRHLKQNNHLGGVSEKEKK